MNLNRHLFLSIFLISALWAVPSEASDTTKTSVSIEQEISAEVERLLDRGMELLYTDPERSSEYFKNAEKLANRSSDQETMALTCQSLSIYYWARGMFQKALECDRRALSLYQALGDTAGIAYSLNGLAVSLTDLGLNHEALKNYLEAERIFTQLNDSSGLQMTYLNLGVVFDEMKDLEAATGFYEQALEIGLKLGLMIEVGDVYNNMAEIKLQQGKMDEAYDLYSRAFKIYKNEKDDAGIALVKGNLADYYSQANNYSVSETLFNEAFEAYAKMEDENGKCQIALGLGQLYRKMKRFGESEEMLLQVIHLAEKHQYLDLFIQAQREFAGLMYDQHEYDRAYQAFIKYDLAKDSLYRESRSREFDNLRMAYEAEEKERQLSALKSEREKEQLLSIEKDRSSNAILAIAILLFLFSITGILFYTRLKKINNKLEEHQNHLELKNAEIAKQAEALQAANEKLLNEKKLAEISSEAKADFVSVLSHEIRTPLNAIVGISHALQEEIEDPGQQEYLNALSHSADTLLGFTNNILDLSKLDAGKLELNEEQINIKSLIKQITNTFETSVKEKGLFLETTFSEDTPQVVEGDKMRLTQILLNLISNAVKYTESGGINLDIKCSGWEPNAVWIQFLVMDTGQGIPEDLQPKIFDRYSRLQFESTLTPQGSGLGLSITKSLVELMGGSISFESEKNQGTTFEVKLRFRPAIATNGEQYSNSEHAPNFSLKGKSILLVEDNEVNVLFTERLLKKLELEVEIARDGEEAVAKSEKSDYDIVLMDLQMPKMNGVDAATHILRHRPESRIIALTANSDNELKDQLRKTGFLDVLIKPFKPAELGNKILHWIQTNHKHSL